MNLEGIHKEFNDAHRIAERVRMREYLKLQAVLLGIHRMNDSLKIVKDKPDFSP
jgi:hypothetical protein